MSDTTEFRVTYDGPALENHEMDPRELAPALLAMADLLDASAKVLYGDKAKVNVNVKGSFKTGSFNVDFVTGVKWLQSVRDIFAGSEATAIANASAILGALGVLGKTGLIPLLKWLRARPITRVELTDPAGGDRPRARIYVGNDFYDTEGATVDLLRDVGVRKAMERVLAPLETSGIDVVALGQGSSVNITVDAGDLPSFVSPVAENLRHPPGSEARRSARLWA